MKKMIFKQYSASILLVPMVCYMLAFFLPISAKQHNNIFYIFVLVPFVMWVQKREFVDIFRSRIIVLIIIFTSYLALRSLFYSPFDLSEIKDPIRHLIALWIFILVAVRLFQEHNFVVKLNYVAWWGALWGIYNAVVFYMSHHLQVRCIYNGPVDHPIIGACVYAVICLFALFGKKKKFLIISLGSAVLLCGAVLLSQSRGPLLSITVAIIIGLMCRSSRKWLFGIPVVCWSFLYIANQQGWLSLNRLFQATSSYRLQIWQQVFDNSMKNGDWLFGSSLLADQTVTVGKMTFDHAHSGYVSTYFHGGIVGVMLLVVLIIVVGWNVLRVWQQQRDVLAVVLFCFAVLIIATDTHKMLDGPGALWTYFWLPITYIVARELKSIESE